MFNGKYGDILTVVIIIIIIAIIGLLGFWAYDVYTRNDANGDALDAINEFDNKVSNSNKNNTANNSVGNVAKPTVNGIASGDITSSGGTTQKLYKGFVMVGYIQIPKTGIEYPILEEASKKAIETSVAILYGPGLNKVGNTVIIGHNYRNGMFFSDNAKISVGDKIYITDLNGNKVTYIVYNTYETTPEDSDYMERDTNGAMEISLSTCTDDASGRIIIWARAEQ